MCDKLRLHRAVASAHAIQAAHAGSRIVDLSRRLEAGMPTVPTHPKYFQMRWCAMGDPAELHQLVLSEHTGTHFDAPSHFVPDPDDPARKHIDEIGLDHFMGRAIKMTFGPFDPVNAQVTADDLRAWEEANIPIAPNDILLIDFQWSSRWALGEAGNAYLRGWPGLSKDAADYLVTRQIKLVGTDCLSVDPGDGGDDGRLDVHYTLLPKGILILENLCNLNELETVSYFMAFPLKIAQGTGSPVRAVAFSCEQVG